MVGTFFFPFVISQGRSPDQQGIHQTCTQSASSAVLPFSKLNNFILGYFDPQNIFIDNENKYFSG